MHPVGNLTAAALASLASLVILLSAAPSVRGGTDHAIDIVDFAFEPATLTVQAGDRVTWINRDVVAHTATSTTGAFDSGDLAQGESYSVTFSQPGTYDYFCSPHPSMTGRIVVVPASAPAPAPAPTNAGEPGSDALPDVAIVTPRSPLPVIAGMALLLIAMALIARGSRRANSTRVTSPKS